MLSLHFFYLSCFVTAKTYMHVNTPAHYNYKNQKEGELCDICFVNWHFPIHLQVL